MLRHDSLIHLLIPKVDYTQRTFLNLLYSPVILTNVGHLVPFSKTQERQRGGGGTDRQKPADKDAPLRNISLDNLYILER